MKGQLVSEDEIGVNDKAPALLQQLSGFLLSEDEDEYGATVRREVLRFLSKLTQLTGVYISLSIADQVTDAVTDLVDRHGKEWTVHDVHLQYR